MQWLRRILGGQQPVQQDPARQEQLLQQVRHHFGARVPTPVADQVAAVTGLLAGDDGLIVAARVVGEVAEEAHAAILTQAFELQRRTGRWLVADRRNYRPLWQVAGPQLRTPLFALPCGFHPYVQVAAAVTVVGDGATRLARITDPEPLLAQLFEVFDLTVAGWEYGQVRVDVDAASLAVRLISATQQIRAALDDPPRLPPPVRDLMRRNNRIEVYHPAGDRVVGTINLGAELRPAMLA
ncbi:hypothetical protein [Micromonospora cathayae]|uniref:GAF domain-containing protein n=1 Tax=Micromonospora cathayae TaxID=3028804 RepID=A0ABY7ZP34_9ACTN|nr:hypothetical protein [Micromonospora sp. HUAS 3]WDZ83634.1 hypothetical protein PVK37_24685 [Micromonospora sp. HUAS 3]